MINKIQVKTKSNLARNMAAEFMKTRGNVEAEEANAQRVNQIQEHIKTQRKENRKAQRLLEVCFSEI